MKQKVFLFAVIFILTGLSLQAICQSKPKPKTPAKKMQTEKVLRHVVLFKFKDSSTPAQVKTVEKAFAALPTKIKTIIGYEWGTNVSPENLAQGFTHCFLVTFKSEADRDAYLPHPAHKEFGKILGPHLDKVLVVDFISQK